MSSQRIPAGRVALLGASSWITGACVTPLLLDGSLTDTCVRRITGATNASPIVITTDAAHGWQNGDLLVSFGTPANGNTAALGTFRAASASGSTLSLQSADEDAPLNTTGNGAWSGTAGIINLTRIADFGSINAAKVGGQTDPVLANCVVLAGGVIDADDPPDYTNFMGNVSAFVLSLGTTPGATGNIPLIFFDGRICVRVAATAASTATSIAVHSLEANLASGTQIVFTNGVTATLSADATAGDKVISVNSLSAQIPVGHNGDAVAVGANLPASLTSGTLRLSFSSGIYRIGMP